MVEDQGFSETLEAETGVPLDDLYQDFIESGEQELAEKAFRLSKFLAAQNSISEILSASLQQEFGLEITVSVDFEADTLKKVVSSNEYDVLQLNFDAYYRDKTSDWAPNYNSSFRRINIASDGRILPAECTDSSVCEAKEISYETVMDQQRIWLHLEVGQQRAYTWVLIQDIVKEGRDNRLDPLEEVVGSKINLVLIPWLKLNAQQAEFARVARRCSDKSSTT